MHTLVTSSEYFQVVKDGITYKIFVQDKHRQLILQVHYLKRLLEPYLIDDLIHLIKQSFGFNLCIPALFKLSDSFILLDVPEEFTEDCIFHQKLHLWLMSGVLFWNSPLTYSQISNLWKKEPIFESLLFLFPQLSRYYSQLISDDYESVFIDFTSDFALKNTRTGKWSFIPIEELILILTFPNAFRSILVKHGGMLKRKLCTNWSYFLRWAGSHDLRDEELLGLLV